MHILIRNELQKLISLLLELQSDTRLLELVNTIADRCTQALQQGKKIIFAGNGGSAADSQHLAAELISRLNYDRPGLAAMALTTDTSALTAIGNDYSFENIFSRQIEAISQAGDIFIGISTSGKSPNILKAFDMAKKQGLITIAFTGCSADLLFDRCDYILNIPHRETPKIQECHIMFGHIICAVIEDRIFGAHYNPKRNNLTVNV